ncbi:MAG: M1 family aminopeptidase [Chitinophagales bacterium]
MNKYVLLNLFLTVIVWSSCATPKALQTPENTVIDTNTQVKNTEEKKDTIVFPYRATKKRVNDIVHTSLSVRFDWEKASVIGQATLQIKPYFYPTSLLTLDAKGFDIHEIALIEGTQKKPLTFAYDSLQLQIQLPETYTKDETYTVFIDYTALPDRLLEQNAGITYDNKGLYFINADKSHPTKPQQIWTQGETEANSCWFPTIDSPNERFTQELYITVQSKYVTFSNGKLISSKQNLDGTRTDYWKQTLDHAPYLVALVVGEFAVVKDKWRDIEVNYYVENEYEPFAKNIFGNTIEMMDFFSELLQYDYPWEQYAQIPVHDYIAGAMENTGAVIFYDGVQRTDRELIDANNEDIVAHELVHHWFGDLLTAESWSNLPLNEAFATYGEYLWFEHKYGRVEADYHLMQDLNAYLSEAEIKQVPIFRFHYADREHMFDRHSYQKGGRVMHLLRNYVGDDAFFAAVRKYVKTNAFQSVEIHNLRLAFEEVTGEDLNWFFDQWFLTKGHPVLEINQRYIADQKLQEITVLQTQEGFVFRLPMSVDIYLADGSVERKNIEVTEASQTFTFEVAEAPKLVNVDANKALLADKTDNKPLEMFAYQLEHAPLFLDQYEAILKMARFQVDQDFVHQAIIKALDSKSWSVRKLALERIETTIEATKTTILDKLKNIAVNDPKSLVRAAALEKLGEQQDTTYIPVFQRAIKDSSYLVMATALRYLNDMAPNDALQFALQLESDKNPKIVTIVSKIYAEKGNIDKQDYFEDRLQNSTGNDRYTLVEFYGDFLGRMGDSALDKGLPTLEQIAISDKNWWIRLNATQSISSILEVYRSKRNMLSSLSGKESETINQQVHHLDERIEQLKNLISAIKTQETHEKLQYYYQNM